MHVQSFINEYLICKQLSLLFPWIQYILGRVGMSDDYERNFGFLIQDVARLMKCAFDRRIKDMGLTPAQWFALAHLMRSNGLTQQQLANQMEMARAPLSKMLSRLEKGGWVKRKPDPLDKRANRIYVTDKFQHILPELRTEANDLISYVWGDLAQSQQEKTIDFFIDAKRRLMEEIEIK